MQPLTPQSPRKSSTKVSNMERSTGELGGSGLYQQKQS